MKHTLSVILSALLLLTVVSCEDFFDTRVDNTKTQYYVDKSPSNVIPTGYAAYGYIYDGLSQIDGNIAAAKSDEAVASSLTSSLRKFNEGTWNAYGNPDDVYSSMYKGIRAANYFTEYSVDYRKKLAHNRDTLANAGVQFKEDIENAGYLRAEQPVLVAYYYFELLKRYGDVPLYTVAPTDGAFLPRTPYQEVVNYIVDLIDTTMDGLAPDWSAHAAWAGRFDQGAAKALKARILLYAASPLNTEGMSDEEVKDRWIDAAQAANEIISSGKYSLSGDYASLFKGNTTDNPEIILSRRSGGSNSFETKNYPVDALGSGESITPSHNLVAAYEEGDARKDATIVAPGSTWCGKTVDIAEGASHSYTANGASRTGYYLKKYLTDNLNLSQGATAVHNWIYYRYGEVLLNYAEAVNELYGPKDGSHFSCGLSAEDAINKIRTRAKLGPVDLSKFSGANDKEKMRNALKAERRVELAFEDHRFWDLLRWRDESALAETIKGVQPNGSDYKVVNVESRVFKPYMVRYPLPYSEVAKSHGVLTQNEGWE